MQYYCSQKYPNKWILVQNSLVLGRDFTEQSFSEKTIEKDGKWTKWVVHERLTNEMGRSVTMNEGNKKNRTGPSLQWSPFKVGKCLFHNFNN